MTSHSKIAQFDWKCIGRLRGKMCCFLIQGLIRNVLLVEMKWGLSESNILRCRTVFYFLCTGTLAQIEYRRSVLSPAVCIWMNFIRLCQFDATVTSGCCRQGVSALLLPPLYHFPVLLHRILSHLKLSSSVIVHLPSACFRRHTPVIMYSSYGTWWHTRRNQISSFLETDESI